MSPRLRRSINPRRPAQLVAVLRDFGAGRPIASGGAVCEPLESRRLLTTVVATTNDDQLLQFDSSNPQAILATHPISGLQASDFLVGIDVRPATGELYGVGGLDRLYTIDVNTGVASFVATLSADPADTTDPFTRLNGGQFGVDFNPVADRLRVVNDTGQNLRINPTNGLVTTDTPLAYDPSDPTGGGKTAFIVDAAYTNSVAGATTTTLLAIDSSLYNTKSLPDGSAVPALSFVRVGGIDGNPSPNGGVLTTTAAFARDGAASAGFDIAPSGTAFTAVKADFSGGTRYLLVEVDPNQPADISHGNIGDGSITVTDIAVVPSLQISAPLVSSIEGGSVTITVTRTEGSAGTFSVDYAAVGGTARAGADFTPTSGTLTFAPTDTSMSFTVDVTDDAVAEDDEFFVVNLSNPTGGATLGGPSSAAVRISANDDLDDEAPTVRSVLLTGPSRKISGAVVHFSEDVDPGSASNAANFSFLVRGKKKRQAFEIASAVYDPATRSTTLAVAPFMQTEFSMLEVRINNKPGGVTDTSGNLLAKTSSRFQFRIFSGTSVTVTDRDGDRGTLTLANGGQIDGIMPVKASRTQRTQFWILDPIALRTTLSGSVQRGTRGDGIIVIAEIIGLDKKEFTPLLTNPSFRVNTLTFSSNATGTG